MFLKTRLLTNNRIRSSDDGPSLRLIGLRLPRLIGGNAMAAGWTDRGNQRCCLIAITGRRSNMSLHGNARAFKIELPQARSFQMQGTLWRVLATGDETGGVVGALDERSAHGIAAPMHVHEDADEIFYVLEGELTFYVGDQRIEAAPGAFVYLPRFVHHGFQVDSKEARIFNFVTPAGFERLVLDSGKPAHYDDAPIPVDPDAHHGQSPPQMLEVFRKKYGMRALPDGSK